MPKNINTIKERDIVVWVNILLAGIVVLLLFYYVLMANTTAETNYHIQTLRDKNSVLAEVNSSLMSRKISLESPIALIEFAKSRNFVEAKNISYIFENKNVAQR